VTAIDALDAAISEQQRFLVRAALAPTESARRAWSSWRALVDFDDIDATAARLLPLLARRPDVLDTGDPVYGRVRGLYRRAWASNEQLMAAARSACEALTDASVTVLHVEALTLASMFGDHGTRPLWDVDVCVSTGSMRTALATLHGLGWVLTPRRARTRARARLQRWPHHLVLGNARLRLIQRTPWPGADPGAWARSIGGPAEGESLLGPHDALVHAAVRSTQPWQPPGGYWVVDLVRVARSLGHTRVVGVLDDPEVRATARVHRASDPLRRAVDAAEAVVGG